MIFEGCQVSKCLSLGNYLKRQRPDWSFWLPLVSRACTVRGWFAARSNRSDQGVLSFRCCWPHWYAIAAIKWNGPRDSSNRSGGTDLPQSMIAASTFVSIQEIV